MMRVMGTMVATGAALCLVLGGCAGAAEVAAEPVWALGDESPGIGFASALETSVAVPPRARYLPTGGGRALLVERHRPLEGGAGVMLTLERVEVEPTASGGGDVAVEGTRSVMQMRATDGGDLVLVRSVEHADDAITVFDPPMLAMPAQLPPGETRTQELRMVVHPRGRPERIKAQGPARRTVVYEVDQRVRTPAGEFDCRRVRSLLVAELGTARVRVETRQWFAAGAGLVAEESTERVTTLGIPIRSRTEGWALERTGQPAPTPGPDANARRTGK